MNKYCISCRKIEVPLVDNKYCTACVIRMSEALMAEISRLINSMDEGAE